MKKILFFAALIFLVSFLFVINSEAACAYNAYEAWPSDCDEDQPLIDPTNTSTYPCRGMRIKYVCTDISTSETGVQINQDDVDGSGLDIEGYYLQAISVWSSNADDDFYVDLVQGGSGEGETIHRLIYDISEDAAYDIVDNHWVFGGSGVEHLYIKLPNGIPDHSDEDASIYIWIIR